MPENNMEENMETGLDLEKGWLDKAKDQLIDNWQTIVIVLIVLIIGAGVYNYQQEKGGAENSGVLSTAVEEQEEKTEELDEEIAIEMDSETDESSSVIIDEEDDKLNENASENDSDTAADIEESEEEYNDSEEPVTISSNNGENYMVSAEKGDGITHLARKALRKYLDENEVSDINDEQKIYIEDYLQNKTGGEFLALGETRNFSENLIEEAVDLSRGLNSKALDNLSGYKTRIANL